MEGRFPDSNFHCNEKILNTEQTNELYDELWTKRMLSETKESVYYIDLNLILVQTFDCFPLTQKLKFKL